MDDAALTVLALAAGQGDRDAANTLVHETYGQVRRLMVVLANRAVADDLTQETFARAVRSLPGFRAESPFRAWLLSIARRTAADHLRATRSRVREEPHGELSPELENPVAGDVTEPVLLGMIVENLDPDRRLAFELTQILGLSYLEAAQVCDCPVGTIRSRVARARDELVGALAEQRAARPQRLRLGAAPGTGRPDISGPRVV
jgi:RNA polymerase sigma-70 factor (ECF subfamily)